MHCATRLGALAGVLALAMGAAACRDSGGDDDGVTPDGGGGDGGGKMTVYDVQSDAVAEGAAVTLEGVIITAIDGFGGSTGNVYVQEPAGGPFSGVIVFGADTTGLAVGDIVKVTGGVKEEFILKDMNGMPLFPAGHSLTEVSPPDNGTVVITKTGTGTVPEPEVVDPVALAASEDEAEKWESVLIKFENVAVLSAPFASMSDPTRKTMDVTGPFIVQSSLAPLTSGGMELTKGTCLASITGLGDYFFDYHLLPRGEADIVTGGTMCPPPEMDVAQCTDMVDNDHNGFTDCQDFSCQGVMGVDCAQDTSIVMIQNGTVLSGTLVNLKDVVVTAKAKYRFDGDPMMIVQERVWVQDATTGAPYSGILVFRPVILGGKDIDTLAVGDVVDVTGRVDEFNGLTELTGNVSNPATITFKSAGSVPTPLVVPLGTLADPAMAEQYEGVLVEVDNASVTSLSLGGGDWSIASGGMTLRVGNRLRSPTGLNVNDCLTSVVGPFDYDGSAMQFYKIQMRDVPNTGGSCN